MYGWVDWHGVGVGKDQNRDLSSGTALLRHNRLPPGWRQSGSGAMRDVVSRSRGLAASWFRDSRGLDVSRERTSTSERDLSIGLFAFR